MLASTVILKNGGGIGKNVKSIYSKSRTDILAILWIFGGFYGIKWLNWMQYKSICPSKWIQILGHIPKNVAKMAILWPKIASATLARALRMVITWPFSSNFDKRIH